MRDPSIHIRRSHLLKILKGLLPKGVDIDGFTNRVIVEAKRYSLPNRLFIESKKIHEEKVNKIKSTTIDEAALMAKLIFAIRKKLKHRGVELIKPSTKDWTLIKTVTEKGNLFCEDFNLPKKEGYTEYITVGMSFMQKFRLTTLPSLYPSICDRYNAITLIKNDTHPDLTKNAHNYYRVYISKITGVINNYENIPEKYAVFIEVVNTAKSFNVPIKTYLNAQLEYFLDKLGTIPTPEQLVSDKAKIRLNEYLVKNGK